jgi:CubicO group peptidase (beta-lactamase class C family)
MPRRSLLACLTVLVATAASLRSTTTMPTPAASPWVQYATPEDAGFSSSALDSVRLLADSARAGAVMAIHRGRVLAAWGDVQRKFQLHSVRKSLVSALYGIGVASGKIDLERTLADLGIDDVGKLTPAEKTARIRDLIAARSGVYLSGAYGGVEQAAERPPRGSHAPGTFWFYNNWDFNVAGVLYERLMSENLYESFGRRIASPLGMEDYAPADGMLVYEPSSTRYPAHTFRMSTRDLARFGQLYLQNGMWNGRTIVPESWVTQSTSAISPLGGNGFREGTTYGYMWWSYAPGTVGDRLPLLNQQRIVVASGTGGQGLFIVPGADLVVVVRGDTDNGPGIAGGRAFRIAEGILAARRGDGAPTPRTIALTPMPLASQQPPPRERPVYPLDHATRQQYVGEYRVPGPTPARVYVHEGHLFGFMPGMGEAELIAVSPDEFAILSQVGVRVLFTRDDSRLVTAMRVELPDRRVEAARIR